MTRAPYYDEGGISIYHGDCLQVLRDIPTAEADAVLTDPPYCSGGSLEAQKNTAAQGLRSATVQAEDFEWFAACPSASERPSAASAAPS